MLRDYKYNPKPITHICPVCGYEVSETEWNNYSMHLGCCGITNHENSFEYKSEGNIEHVDFNRKLAYIKTNV